MRLAKRSMVMLLAAGLATASVTGGSMCTGASQVEGAFTISNGSDWKYGIGDAMGFNENTYKSIEKSTSSVNWRDGSVTANGEIGFIESCDPKEDVFIFNNTKIVTDNTEIYETPNISGILDQQRLGAINRDDFSWINEVNRYAQETYGTGWGMEWTRKYQPAAQYRIINNSYSAENSENYNRYTNYETGEVGVQWKDNSGNEWNRRSFASRSDEIIVTYIEAPEGEELDITITMDHMVEMCTRGTVYNRPDSDYVVTEDDKGYAFGMVAKYPIQNRKGSKQPEEALFARGGWGTATRIVTSGNIDYAADKRNITVQSGFGGGTISNANDPKLTITGTNSAMLITKVDRIDTGCNNVNDVKEQLYNPMLEAIDGVIGKYNVISDETSYQALLAPHAAIHGGMFNNVRIDLCSTDDEKADRELTNSELMAKQEENNEEINKAYLERIYNNGRFGLICASGYGTTKLGAIWSGEWEPMWSGDYTLDANTNLQISGMNTGNMRGAGDGYINFIVRMVEDWVDDANHVYGMTDAIKAPPRVDGTGQAGSYHFSDTFPHIYVNGITDWLIIPIFEYWQCYGNQEIPLGKDIDPERNREVLDWSDEDIARIESTGYMNLEEDILYPMLKKTMNFWLQYVDERFYTDGDGVEHADDGTTISEAIAAGDTNCKYIYSPGYSPENSPKGFSEVSKEALTYNTTMDISASRSTLAMARQMIEVINPSDKDELLAKWADFETKIPDYLYADTGELKEWATPRLEDDHAHRHISHAYVAWPSYDTQTSPSLREGVIKAVEARSAAFGGSEATESHGAVHKSLVQARLKNVEGLEKMLAYLMSNGYQYTSMMSSHDRNHDARSYCSDSAFGIMGAVNESLLYSNTGVIEILPTLLSTAYKGSITGLRARSNTQCDIEWDVDAWKASVTMKSDADNNSVKLRCGTAWKNAFINGVKQNISIDGDGMPYVALTLSKGVPVKVDFELDDSTCRLTAYSTSDISKPLAVGDSITLKAEYTFARTQPSDVTWHVENVSDNTPIAGAAVNDDTLNITDAMAGKVIRAYVTDSRNVRSAEVVFYVAGAAKAGVEANCSLQEDELGVYLTGDATAKNLMVIWAFYDAAGNYVGISEKDVALGAGEYKAVKLQTAYDVKGLTSYAYVWDKNTQTPYTGKIKIK